MRHLRTLLAIVAALGLWGIAQAQVPSASGTAVYQHRALYAAPNASAIASANVPVTVFPANSVVSGFDITNTGTATLYIDLVGTAAAGSATSIPIASGATFRSPFPPTGAVTAVAATAQSFVAVRY